MVFSENPKNISPQKFVFDLLAFARKQIHDFGFNSLTFKSKPGPGKSSDFVAFESLHILKSLSITKRGQELNGPFLWQCNLAAFIGTDAEKLIAIIEEKTEKQKNRRNMIGMGQTKNGC